MQPFSLLIIVKNRRSHLENVLRALPASTVQPAEVIIVHMNEEPYGIDSSANISQYQCTSDEPLPLAAARNMAASKATTDTLIFLDVDCIPAPDCFATLLTDLSSWQLSMVDPRYLQQPVGADDLRFAALAEDGRANPARNGIVYGPSDRYELFWSLGFAIQAADFKAIGGFDEAYVGYGGEDTDFAFSARRAGVSFGFSKAVVYHQNHDSYDPPLNWLTDIVTNANQFHAKWGIWPMDGWLKQFEAMGYVDWQPDTLQLRTLPSAEAIEACRRADALG
jgi:GT2 family glycosyltransferase